MADKKAGLLDMYQVKLEVFEGPLDLLLYLIRKNEIDIYNIPIAEITEQYLEYLDQMQSLDINIASEFILMAATLLHMKSELLLPSGSLVNEEEMMLTREELVRQLLEYKKFKEAAMLLSVKEEKRMELYPRSFTDPAIESLDLKQYRITASLFDLLSAFHRVMSSSPPEEAEEIVREEFTIEQKIEAIMKTLEIRKKVEFSSLFDILSPKLEIIVTFLAVLELVRIKYIVARQSRLFGKIWLYKLEEPTEVEISI